MTISITGTIIRPAFVAILTNAAPLGTNSCFFVFSSARSSSSIRAGNRVIEQTADMTIPLISTTPMSKPILKLMNSRAASPAMVVSPLADTGFIHSRIADAIGRPHPSSRFFLKVWRRIML